MVCQFGQEWLGSSKWYVGWHGLSRLGMSVRRGLARYVGMERSGLACQVGDDGLSLGLTRIGLDQVWLVRQVWAGSACRFGRVRCSGARRQGRDWCGLSIGWERSGVSMGHGLAWHVDLVRFGSARIVDFKERPTLSISWQAADRSLALSG